MKIILALGNPEPDYNGSRHNVGFAVLNQLATELGAKWADKSKFDAVVAETDINGEKLLLVKPTTYYNETGLSARKITDFYKSDPATDLLVLHDDMALPFGMIRVRGQGGDAGNNGIKSLNDHIGVNYVRIRIGTSNDLREQMDDTAFVLGKFSADESAKLADNIIPRAIELTQHFCAGTLEKTSHKTLE
ncbi:MAG: aminoacyl-tRNA hydrolase [Candidatus Saccharibacteria bacterium]